MMPDLLPTKSMRSIKGPKIVEEQEDNEAFDWDHQKLEELKEMQRQEEQKENWAWRDIDEASEDGFRLENVEEISSRNIDPKKSKMLENKKVSSRIELSQI